MSLSILVYTIDQEKNAIYLYPHLSLNYIYIYPEIGESDIVVLIHP